MGGHGGLLLIGGEAGIGKTALATAIGEHAAVHGAEFAIGRCY
jgi:MoxR-like ATPase